MPPDPAAPFSDITTYGESVPSINDGPQCELVQLNLNYSQGQIESRQSLLRLFEEKTFCLIRKLLQTTCQVSCFHLKTSEKTAVAYDFNLFNKCIKGCHKRFHSFSTVNGIYLKIFATNQMFVSLLQPICRQTKSLKCSENCVCIESIFMLRFLKLTFRFTQK